VPNSHDDHARNRRVEITITPTPPTFHAPEPATKSTKKTGAP
jgi:hypothetical protein